MKNDISWLNIQTSNITFVIKLTFESKRKQKKNESTDFQPIKNRAKKVKKHFAAAERLFSQEVKLLFNANFFPLPSLSVLFA